MLVLQQELGHREDVVEIWLPDGRTVEVELVAVRGQKARIGYTAPPDVKVHRKTTADTIRRQGDQGYRNYVPRSDARRMVGGVPTPR